MIRFNTKGKYVLLLLVVVTLLLIIGTRSDVISQFESVFNKSALKPAPVYYQNKAIVLIYHNFAQRECGTAITPARFAKHMNMLDQEGFNVVSLDDVVMFVQGKKPLPPNAIAITMDDGYESNYTVAYPLLKKKHWPAAVFVRVSDMGPDRSAGLGNKWLDWPDIKELSQGNVMIGSHSYSGHQFINGTYPKGQAWLASRLANEDQKAYEQRIYADLALSKDILQKKLGTKVEHFAHPFGIYNEAVLDMAKKSDYKYIWTTKREPITRNSSLYSLGRVSVGIGGTTPEQLKNIIIEIGQK